MAATGTPTPNIGLRCPVGTDPASVDDINYNSGVIDTKLGAVGSTSVQAQIDALNSKILPKQTQQYDNENGFWLSNISGNIQFGVDQDGNGFFIRFYTNAGSYRLYLSNSHGYVQKYTDAWITWHTLY